MNHIYKVIWNKAKHCYTVVSEIAKNHSTNSVTKKKVSIAAILAAGMLSGFSPMVSGAADTTNSEAVVYDQNQTSLKSTNSNGVGKNAIALGKGAFAVANSIAIGNGAYTQDGNRENGQSVALGNGAVTGAKSTSIGANAIGGREGTITIGANANNGAVYATIVGTDSSINYESRNSGAVSTVIGSKNNIKNDDKMYSGVASSILGAANTIENSNGVTIQGTGNTVTGAYKNMNLSISDLLKLYRGDYSVLAEKENGAIAIIGGANTISSQTSSTVIGFGNTLKGENSTGVFTAGSHNKLTNVSNSLVMGDHNTLVGRKNVISLGNNNTVGADDAVAIGNGTTVRAESGVAIGVGSVADRVAGSEKGALGAFAPANIPTTEKSTWTSTKGAVSVGDTANDITRQITNVAAGSEDTDAVNVAQLKQVASQAERAKTTVSAGTNTTVTSTVAEDGHTDYKVNLNKDLTGIESMTNGLSSIRMGNGGTVTINNRVTIDQSGKISGVAAGEVKEGSTDAVNGSQLHAVQQEAGKHTKVVNGSNITVEETDQDGQKTYKVGLNKDLLLGDITGKNVSISGTNGTIETTGFIATKDKIYADKGAKLADVNVTGDTISNDKSSVKLDKDGTVTINKMVTIDQSGKISGVAAGEISSTSTDAVNGSQLHAVQQEAGKHTKVVNGSNITVEETDQDGQKTYKVGLNKDLLLGDITGKNVSISGTNGTIETTGFIATKDKIYADKGAKLADVNVTGDTISNDKSSVKLDKDGTVTINKMVTIDQSGKISGVAAGEISSTSTDAVNGSQLKATNDRVSKVEGDITNIKSDITDIKGDVKNLGDRVTKVEQEAGKHTKVVNGSNVTVEATDQDGQKTYKVGLNKDLLLGDITGKNVSISGTNGTIETTGFIATKDKIYADKGAKLADIDITGDTISNGQSSVKLDKEGTVTINGKVSVNQDGKVSGVAAGDISATSTDAVNGSQLFATNQQVVQNAQSINKLGNRINKVGAGAAALAALHPLDFDPDDKWDFAAGYGNYNGENAAAIGAYYRPNEDTMFSVGGSFGNGENMVNAGVSLKLGQGNHVSTSKVAMAKEIKDLRKELEGLKSALLDANAGKKLDTSKLQLFPDVPKNHWAYEYVSTLKGNGALTGYPDGEFKGDRPMTRYEFATMLYKAMLEGATLSDKILKEFAPELERFTVDTVHQDKDGKPTVERVRTVKAEK